MDEVEDPAARINLQLKVANQIKALSDSLLKVQKRESAIVPNNAPKVLQLEETKTYTLDMFLDVRKQMSPGDELSGLLSANVLNAELIDNSVPSDAQHVPLIISTDNTIDGELVE